MFRKTRIISTFVLLVLALALVIPSHSAAYLYSGNRKKVACAIANVGQDTKPLGSWLGVFRSAANGGVGDIFYLLDNYTSIKPSSWILENPYSYISASTTGKASPDYWIVDIDSASDLSDINILYLPATGNLALSQKVRDNLRKFVDGGGVLWIDNTGGSTPLDFNDTFFIPGLKFAKTTSSGFDVPASRHHPLLTSPYWLTEQDIASLGSSFFADKRYYCEPGYDPTKTWGDITNQPINNDVLLTIVNNSSGSVKPSIAANAIGSGYVVATSNFVGGGCFYDYPYNLSCMKFVYNAMAWSSSWMSFRKDARHTGFSLDTIGSNGVNSIWEFNDAPPTAGKADSRIDASPVIYKNVAFYTSGKTLYALDIMPSEDIDQDGNTDDGFQDIQSAATYKGEDVIWQIDSPDSSDLSTPTIVTIQNPTDPSKTIEAVIVLSKDGTVYMFDAFPSNASGQLLSNTNQIASHDFAVTCDPPYSPVYINGWIYVVGGDGRLYAYNPSLKEWLDAGHTGSSSDWVVPGSAAGDFTGNAVPRGCPSYAVVECEKNNAMVGTIYWTASKFSGSVLLEQNDYIYSIPVNVANDRTRITAGNPGGCYVTFTTGKIAPEPAPCTVYVKHADGTIDPYDISDIQRNKTPGGSTQNGAITIPANILQNDVIYANYSLDYSDTTSMPSRNALAPSSLSTNPVAIPKSIVAATPTIAADSSMFICARRENIGGSVYAIKNDGQTHKTKWNYFLHGGADSQDVPSGINIPQLPGVIHRLDNSALDYNDVTNRYLSMAHPQPMCSPVVANDKVFVTVSSDDATNATGALLCLKANPPLTIRIVKNNGYDENGKPNRTPVRLINESTEMPMNVKIWQPDLLTGTSSSPALLSARDVPSSMIDYERGTITITNFDSLKIKSGSGVLTETNTFTPSLPVWVFLDNVEVPIDFSTWNPSIGANAGDMEDSFTPKGEAVDLSQWNSLLWYYIIPDGSASSSPVVIGNTVYFVSDNGKLYALNTETGKSDSKPLTTAEETKYVLMDPLDIGASLPTDTNTSIAASNGILLLTTADGVKAFGNTATLVADSNRLVELDGAGDVKWSLDTISVPVSIPRQSDDIPGKLSVAINKPSGVKYTSEGDILVVNTGANQVYKIDKSGTVGYDLIGPLPDTDPATTDGRFIRWIYDKFADPDSLLGPGQQLSLNAPSDAILWQEQEYDSDAGKNILVVHCMIADSGNQRILDLVYRIDVQNQELLNDSQDPNTGYYLPELKWVTKTGSANQRYNFENIQIVPSEDAGISYERVWASISNYSAETGGVGGAIVAINYRQRNAGTWDAWNYMASKTGEIGAYYDRVNDLANVERRMYAPKYFSVSDKPDGRYVFICDNYGVYKSKVNTTSGKLDEVAILTNEDYSLLPRYKDGSLNDYLLFMPLQPTFVQELPNGNWLITNGYTGKQQIPDQATLDQLETDSPTFKCSGALDAGAKNFSGEVFEYDPVGVSIIKSAPKIILPNSTDVYDWKQQIGNSFLLKQPRAAVRQF